MAENPAVEDQEAHAEEEAAKEQEREERQEQEESEQAEKEEEEDEERPVASSMLESWGYDREGEEIFVTFLNGKSESYSCTVEQWLEAQNAPSPGKWMHENVL